MPHDSSPGSDPPFAGCPADSVLFDFSAGRVSSEVRGPLQAHIDRCTQCASLIAALAQTMSRSAAPGPTPMAAFGVPDQVAEFRLIRALGHGAMGQVFMAQDTFLDRLVAVKFLAAAQPSATAKERFFVEARAVARLSHPNVVTLYRAGEENGKPYLVSEFVRGQSLDYRKKPIPEAQLVPIAVNIARGLAAAHARGVLHRDIKPANVMMTRDDQVKLLDFGLAKILEVLPGSVEPAADKNSARSLDQVNPEQRASPDLTTTGALLGTPLYMAPEIWNGQPATPQSDIYSLGAMLFELASGRPPHQAPSAAVLGFVVMERDAPPVAQVAPGLHARLAAVIDRCLRRDPAQRFTSSQELCQALEKIARPALAVSRRLIGAGLFVVFALLVVVAGMLLRQVKSERALAAQQQKQEAQMQQLLDQRHRALRDRQIEMGTRAAALARQPDKQVEALVTGVQAVGLSLLEKQPPPAQATAGLSAALSATSHLLPGRRFPARLGVGNIESAEISRDGRRLLMGGDDSVAVWDVASGRPLSLLIGHKELRAAAFSPDARTILTSSRRLLQLWDIESGQLIRTINLPGDRLPKAPFSPDGAMILTLDSAEPQVRLWSAKNGALIAILRGHSDDIADVRFSHDGALIVSASKDGTARIWNGHTGQPRDPPLQHRRPVRQARFSENGALVLTLDDDSTVYRWNTQTGALITSIDGYRKLLTGIDLALDGPLLLALATEPGASDPRKVLDQLRIISSSDGQRISAVLFSPDIKHLLTIDYHNQRAALWDFWRGRMMALLPGGMQTFRHGRFSSDGQLFLAPGLRTTWLWDFGPIRSPANENSDGAAVHQANQATLESDVRSELLLKKLRRAGMQPGTAIVKASGVVISRSGQRAVTLGDRLDLWDAKSGLWLADLSRGPARSAGASFSPDEHSLVTFDGNRSADLWNADTGQWILEISGHHAPVESATFSPDGQQILTAASDQTAQVFDIKTAEVSTILHSPLYGLRSARFTSDGQHVTLIGKDGTVREHAIPAAEMLLTACQLLEQGSRSAEIVDVCRAATQLSYRPSSAQSRAISDDFWLPGYAEQAGYRATRSKDCSRPGATCLALQHSGRPPAFDGVLGQRIDAAPFRGKRVHVSARVRTELIDANGHAHLRLQHDSERWGQSPLDDAHHQAVRTRSWQPVDLYADVPSYAEELTLGLVLHGAGQAWFSDLALEVVAPSAQNRPFFDQPRNLSLEAAEPDGVPSGWTFHEENPLAGYGVTMSTEQSHSGLQNGTRSACITRRVDGAGQFAAQLFQQIDAAPYRGQRVRVSAAIRTVGQGDSAGQATLKLVALAPQRGPLSRDQRPAGSTSWRDATVFLEVPADASALGISLSYQGSGSACFDDVRFDVFGSATPTTNESVLPEQPSNLDLERGTLGRHPDGWFLANEGRDLGYRAELSDASPRQGQRAACLHASKAQEPNRLSTGRLMQHLNAAPFRGKRIRLRAAIRTDVTNQLSAMSPMPKNHAQLWFYVVRQNGSMGFRDYMSNRPITFGEWHDYEISGTVDVDAKTLSFGLALSGKGVACIDDVHFEIDF